MEIKILDKTWEIVYGNQNNSILQGRCNGYCNKDEYEIIISTSLNKQSLAETIAHELAHAIIFQLMGAKDTFTDEEVAMFIGTYNAFIANTVDEILNNPNTPGFLNAHYMNGGDTAYENKYAKGQNR